MTTLLLIPLTFFLVLYLPWNAALASIQNLTKPPDTDPNLQAEPKRDLKFLLHPEDHVSRDLEVRRYSWNVTKAMRAPNGVEKEVFLINGTANTAFLYSLREAEILTRLDQFPGPTIEARSGDTLEIEVYNFSEEEMSLHWHGLHMRGSSNIFHHKLTTY